MLVESQSGVRCQGLYRGQVILHLLHGRLKVFVYGVYPEEYINLPELLPICELITPLWGGSFAGNGSISYPNIGSTVWVLFANEDVNYPVVIGATLGGENAYHQYEQIKDQDEEISKKHMFTTGMAHFQMHESGKISALVQLPYDNNVSIDFSLGDVSCDVSADIEDKIKNNEISHIICLHVIDNELNNGEISSSTFYFEPIKYENLDFSDDMLEITIEKDIGYISSFNYDIQNNLGDNIDNELSTIKNERTSLYVNGTNEILKLLSETENNKTTNVEITNITGKKDINLYNNEKIDSSMFEIDKLQSTLKTDNKNSNTTIQNIDQNYIDDKRNILLLRSENIKNNFVDITADRVKLLNIDQKIKLNQLNILKIDGEYNTYLSNNNKFDNNHLIIDSNGVELSSTKGKHNKYNIIKNISGSKNQIVIENKLEKELSYTKLDKTLAILSNLSYTKDTTNNNIIDSDTIGNSIINKLEENINNTNLLTLEMVTKKENTTNITENYIDPFNLKLYTNKKSSVLSTYIIINNIDTYLSIDTFKTGYNANKTLSNLLLLSIYNYTETLYNGMQIDISNLTSDSKLSFDVLGSSQLYNTFKYEINNIGRNYELSIKEFKLSGKAGDNFLVELSSYETNNDFDIINSSSKIELATTKDNTSILLKSTNKKDEITCYSNLETNKEKQKYETVLKNNNTEFKILIDPNNESLEIISDGNGSCKIKLDTTDGSIYLMSDKNINLNSTNVKIKSDVVNIDSGKTNIKFSDGMNIASKNSSKLEINSEVDFRLTIAVMNNVFVQGQTIAQDVIAHNDVIADNISLKTIAKLVYLLAGMFLNLDNELEDATNIIGQELESLSKDVQKRFEELNNNNSNDDE